MLLELAVLAVLSAFWPTLLLVDILAFQTPKPERVLVAFLAGGLVSTLTIGTLLVVKLQDASFLTRSRTTTDPVVNIVLGCLAFAAAWALARTGGRTPKHSEAKHSTRLERAIRRGAPIAFVAGLIVNIVPGVFPLIAIKDIAELDYTAAASFGVLFAFYLVMFAFIEIPIGGYLFAPARTETRVTEFNAWLGANARRLGVWALLLGGTYLTVRGIVQLV